MFFNPTLVIQGLKLQEQVFGTRHSALIVDSSALIKLANIDGGLDLLYRTNRPVFIPGEVFYEATKAKPMAADAVIIEEWISKGEAKSLLQIVGPAPSVSTGRGMGETAIAKMTLLLAVAKSDVQVVGEDIRGATKPCATVPGATGTTSSVARLLTTLLVSGAITPEEFFRYKDRRQGSDRFLKQSFDVGCDGFPTTLALTAPRLAGSLFHFSCRRRAVDRFTRRRGGRV